MEHQLRASVFISEDAEVMDEIPIVVHSDPGAINLQVGEASISFNDRQLLIALLSSA